MHRTSRHRGTEHAATSLEFVGVAIAAMLLVGGVAASLRADAPRIGSRLAEVARELVTGEQVTLRTRTAREVRTGGGSVRVRVARDELRMRPVLDPVAWWEDRWHRAGSLPGGIRASIDARACAACASLEWSHELEAGALAERGAEPTSGIGAAVEASGRLAIASADVTVAAERRFGSTGAAFVNARLRGTVGVEADAAARLRLTREDVDVELEGGAMTGAVVQAQVRGGVDLLGVAIRQSGRAEGWAGAGARGVVGVRARDDRLEWRAGWGGALGFGGAAEWSGSIDVSGVPRRHRRLARDALAASILGPAALPLRLGR